MYNNEPIRRLINYIHLYDGYNDKDNLELLVQEKFNLELQRSVFTCNDFSIRFSKADNINFCNVVLSLSSLKKYDRKPFFVCAVTPTKNYILLSNTTMLDKISHSSLKLRVDNIKGSFLGSNIMREVNGFPNTEENFEKLFELHARRGYFEGNLQRLVDATSGIKGYKHSVALSDEDRNKILDAVNRSMTFVNSPEHKTVFEELNKRVNSRKDLIKLASKINNVNIRGRLVEYIITGDSNDPDWIKTMNSLKEGNPPPRFKTKDDLGDYKKYTSEFHIKADIKSEITDGEHGANPKGYNVDKMLDFLSDDKSVFCLFFVGLNDQTGEYGIKIAFCSMFDDVLLANTHVQHHWAGRGTRGVAQFNGTGIKTLLNYGPSKIDQDKSKEFLEQLMNIPIDDE